MTTEQAKAFLAALNCQQIKEKPGWVNATCPLAPWLHQHHTDHSPSFGITVNPGQRSHFHCFACRRGSASELVQMLQLYAKGQLQQYDFTLVYKLLDEEYDVLPLPEFREFKPSAKEFVEWPQYWLDSFKPVEYCHDAQTYLAGRGVPADTIQKFDLRYDSARQMVVAPYRDVFGRFAGARGRSIHDDTSGPAKHWDYRWNGQNNCSLVWFNEPVLNLLGPVVTVEGQFDCFRVALRWPKVLANLTAIPTFEKVRKLGDCPMVIHIPDDDLAGEQSIEAYRKACKTLGIAYRLLEIKGSTPEEKLDPDKCHPDYLYKRIMECVS